MSNARGYNDLDALMRELEEADDGFIEQSGAYAAPQSSAPVNPAAYRQNPANVRQNAGYAQQTPVYTQQNPVYQQNTAPQNAQRSRFHQRTTNGYAFSFGDEQPSNAVQPQNDQVQPQVDSLPQTEEWKKTDQHPSRLSVAKLIRDSIMLLGMVLIFTASSMVMLSSGAKQSETVADQKSFFEDLNAELISFRSNSVSAIFDIPKVYILPWDEKPTPVPNPAGYSSHTAEDGTEVLTYEDPTITVKYWTERHYDSTVHYSEIKVAHPTQLRTAFAGGEYSDSVQYMPIEIARGINAVAAINGDYCNYRKGGIIVRQNVVYRNTARGWDILLIDSDGNFHIMADSQVVPSGVMEEYEIVNTLEFGPSLVVDGQINLINIESGCGPTWNEQRPSPRTGIGQIGELHYLFCVVEGRSETSLGVLTSQLAQLMYDKGCVQAYNLDGGQSATMIFNGKAMNEPLWGSQRVVSEVIFCASAMPAEEVSANE